jgi:hypothetical protein
MRVSRTVLGEHYGEVPFCYSTLRKRNQVKYSFISELDAKYPVSVACKVMEVCSSAYYV